MGARGLSDPREPLPIRLQDYRTRHAPLRLDNLALSLLANCSIPFWLDPVRDIPPAPPGGVYWDGGITDYHLHLDYASIADAPGRPEAIPARVLYPHFQAAVVPGWLDKHLKRRHRATARLANVIVLTPDPAWVRTLPNGKLPDRRDFKHYGTDTRARVAAWSRALRESERLRDEFAAWARGASGYAAQPLRRTPPARISESGCI